MKEEQVTEVVTPKKPSLGSSSSLRDTNLMVILSDEGGLPVFTRFVHVNKFGDIEYRTDTSINAKNENIVLMSGLIEAIMQLKDIIKPTLTELTNRPDLPLYVDYAKADNGIALVSLATSPEYQQLPLTLLSQYSPMQLKSKEVKPEVWEEKFQATLGEDALIYKQILSHIKSNLAEFISFILVYDEEGKYLFSTAKHKDLQGISDPLINSISKYIKQEYFMRKHRDNLSLIGAKRLRDSVIWHFKCYNKIFVFFTYVIPDLYDFDTLKTEMITFITNNLEKFISATAHFTNSETINAKIQTDRFIFLS